LIKVGITGGIGAGKSLVCSVLEHLGYPVFYSDQIAKKIVDTNEEVKSELVFLFGDLIYESGKLNRTLMAELLFSDKSKIEKVNSIIHPKVRLAFENWAEVQKSSIVFNEAAILFETGSYKQFDATILVTASLEVKIQRVIKRDLVTEEQVKNRIKNQWTDEEKLKLATYIIDNNGDIGILEQIERILIEIIGSIKK
jgi:dephospho-CoA kinase